MSGKAFLDTNVFVYAASPQDLRFATAVDLLREGGTISVQVLNEFANVARRKLRRSWPEVLEGLSAMRVVCPDPLPLTTATHETAMRIAEQAGIGIYDALIVASALEGGCALLLTEDLQDGRIFAGQLTIRNPFRDAWENRDTDGRFPWVFPVASGRGRH